jgi:hypothetical protein
MLKTPALCLMAALCLACMVSYGQSTDSVTTKMARFPARLFSQIQSRTTSLDRQLARQTRKYLQQMTRHEAALKKQLYKVDSGGSRYLFLQDPEQQYAALMQKVKTDTSRLSKPTGVTYLPYADSLQGAAAFLSRNPALPGSPSIDPAAAQVATNQLQTLQAKMMDADYARQFMVQRKEQINQYMLTHAPFVAGIKNIYTAYNTELLYYTQQLNAYKDMLNDPGKLWKNALAVLDRMPAFTAFMQKNSFLSGLFDVSPDYNMESQLAGMQTREMVNGMLQKQVSGGGPDAASALSQSLQSAQSQLTQLKAKLATLGSGGQNADLPANFKANSQKTKTLWQRLRYGVNLQTVQGNYFFPTTTDVGVSVGYQLTDKSTIGVGTSYKIGWGSDISHIRLSGQGSSIRSFLDYKLRKGFSLTGGYEFNYQPESPLLLTHITTIDSWQRSGLIGLSKTVSMKTKFFKETKVQLLWDFLSYQQVPKAQPILFRVGYTF